MYNKNKKSDIKLLERISKPIHRSAKGYELAFCQVSRRGGHPRIDLRYFGPDGTPGTGVALDDVQLDDLLEALQEALLWKDNPENIAF